MKNLDLAVQLVAPFIDGFSWKKGNTGKFFFSGLDFTTLNNLVEENLFTYYEDEWDLICRYRDFMIKNVSANCYGVLDIKSSSDYNIYILGVVGRPSEERYVGMLLNNLKDLCWPIRNLDYKFLKYKDLYYTWLEMKEESRDSDNLSEEDLLCQEK